MGWLAAVPPVLSAVSSAVSAGSSIYGQVTSEKAARQLWESQREVNATNIAITDKQMAFQERMSSTAHQRQIEDMRKAGLNPILSAGSGASSPGGSAVQIQSPGSPFEGIGTSARDSGRLLNELKTAGYQRNMLKSTADNARANADLTGMEVKFARKDPAAYFASKSGALNFGTAKAGSWFVNMLKGVFGTPEYKKYSDDFDKKYPVKRKTDKGWR